MDKPRKAHLSRLGVYGDLWMRYLTWGARHVAFFTEPIAVAIYTLGFFLLASKPRRAVMANLAVILPGSTPVGNFFRALRVFWNFAWTITDAAHIQEGREILSWTLLGADSFEELQRRPGGVLILTAHMGSYDIAAAAFSDKLGRKLNAVRIPEKNPEMQAFMEKTRDQHQGESYQIHYNRPESLLGVELAQMLARGEAVAIQGDRVLADVSPAEVPFEGHRWRLPKGPFVLALAARVPIQPLFILRIGWREYQILCAYPLPPLPATRDREAAIRQGLENWSHVLATVVRRYWYQWFVLEPAFVLANTPAPAPKPQSELYSTATIRQPARLHDASAATTATLTAFSVGFFALAVCKLLHGCCGTLGTVLLIVPGIFILTQISVYASVAIFKALRSLSLLETVPARNVTALLHWLGFTVASIGLLGGCVWEKALGGAWLGFASFAIFKKAWRTVQDLPASLSRAS